MAPEREVARGSPQDSICMTVAARLGSTAAAFAQRTISLSQCWTSLVKMGESPLATSALESGTNDQIGVVMFASAAGAAGEGNLNAINAINPMITRAAMGGRA